MRDRCVRRPDPDPDRRERAPRRPGPAARLRTPEAPGVTQVAGGAIRAYSNPRREMIPQSRAGSRQLPHGRSRRPCAGRARPQRPATGLAMAYAWQTGNTTDACCGTRTFLLSALIVRFGLSETTDLLVTPTPKPPMPRWPLCLPTARNILAYTVAFTVASDPCATRSRSPPDTPAAYQAAALARSHCAARHTSAPNPKSRPALLRPRCGHAHRRSLVTL